MKKTFKEFLLENDVDIVQCINEEIHSELQEILDSRHIPLDKKLNHITKKVRELGKHNVDTGLESGKPKKGSSRAVFFPVEHKEIVVDGQNVKVPTAVKIAFHGQLDHYKDNDDQLLGEMQNDIEGDHFIRRHHSVLSEDPEKEGHFTTNENGITVPVLSSHPENHHLEMIRLEKMKKSDFKNLTKNEEFPKGLNFDDFHNAIKNHWKEANGQKLDYPKHPDHEKILDHPISQNTMDLVGNFDLHPVDLTPNNWGIYTHPITGEKHPVIADYGSGRQVIKEYGNRRMKMYKKRRGW